MAGGSGGGARGSRPPSYPAYYVALSGVVLLLVLLCCYLLYFCLRRIKELSKSESLVAAPPACPAPRAQPYAVQPAVREGATAMAKLCQRAPTSANAGPTLDTQSGHSEPTLSTDASDTGPTLTTSDAKASVVR